MRVVQRMTVILIDTHLSNVTGLGATQLVASLLPALESVAHYQIRDIYLPDRGELSVYRRRSPGPPPTVVRRRLPNAVSRLVESFSRKFETSNPMLVLGDMPLRVACRQTVFLQTPHFSSNLRGSVPFLLWFKHRIARSVFRCNLRYVTALIVQTDVMRQAVIEMYPTIRGKVFVVPQPVPQWLLNMGGRGKKFVGTSGALRLFYPSSGDAHKNIQLLSKVQPHQVARWPVRSLELTVDAAQNPNPTINRIRCLGRLGAEQMIEAYMRCDALLFLSLAESWGFPLVEAMWWGLPIVCPDLPYARCLCGDMAIYFDPFDTESLTAKIVELNSKLSAGWWPNWTQQLRGLPGDWSVVAKMMLDIASGHSMAA